MTEILDWNDSDDLALGERVLGTLERGLVVALPTETVYGLFVVDDPTALARLHFLKGRGKDKPLARYVSDLMQAEGTVGPFPPAARRLAQSYWPGPLTIVTDSKEGSIGWRCSSHPLIRRVALSCAGVVLGTSANRSGESPLLTAEDLVNAFGDELGLIVRDDAATSGEASTVIMIRQNLGDRPSTHQILRAGGIAEGELREILRPQVLFVCTGNTCRSPLAEVIAAQMSAARENGDRPHYRSAGLAAWPGDPASEGSSAVANELGLDLLDHRSQPVTPDLVDESDLIFTMTESHRERLVSLFPEHLSRIHRLDPTGDIVDPIGGGPDVYRQCAAQIARSVRAQLELAP